MSKKKRAKLFYPIYFSVLIAAVAAIWILCSRLRPYLADYELSNPQYAAEAAMRYFETADAETFYQYTSAAHPELFQYEDKQAYISWMSALTQDASFEYNMAYSSDPDVRRYNVKMNGEKFGAFSLREKPASTQYGFSTWEFDGLETIVPEAVSYSVLAPSDAAVFAGDQRLSEENAVETDIATPWTGHMLKEETSAPTQTLYAFTRFFGCPAVTAVDAAGKACVVTGDEAAGFTVLFNNDDALQIETEARVREFVTAFSSFTASDLTPYRMLKYVRKGTRAYSIIENFDNQWFGKHQSTSVENLVMENVIRFTEDTMACDIHYDYAVHYSTGDEQSYPTAYRFYFVLRNGEWFLYDLEAIE
ncbi:MAG: hypothetical protein J5602_12055 [Clostridia bacterium]|nr:hypothetical protein [Clostridia bacterium]MBO4886035.1 hypothetical protein [Clostridia bacterium]